METYKEYKDRKFFFALAANASPFSSSRAEFEKFLESSMLSITS